MNDVSRSIRRLENFYKHMKTKIILAIVAAAAALPVGPEYDSIGVIATLDGQRVTLDHEGASAAQLAPGRTAFQAYGDILAESPLAPGSRVAFKFHKVGDAWELTELTTR